MTGAAIFGFPESAAGAARLADELGVPAREVLVHRFPDGESLVRVEPPARVAVLYRSLDHPNEKLVELLLAASALKDNGARRVILVAPYLAYMRQDMAFHAGEAVSQRVVGSWLSAHFDTVLAIDPHLHRIASLSEIMPGVETACVSAAPALSAALDWSANPLLVGPDEEARQWVEAIAAPLEFDVLVGRKRRDADRRVELDISGVEQAAGRRIVLVDDVISSGETMIAAARLLFDAGASEVEALATHCLAREDDLTRMRAAGICSIRSTDTVPGPTASVPIAQLVAGEIRRRGWLRKR